MIVLSWDFHCAACKDCCYLFVGVTALCLVQNYAVCKRHSMTLLYLYAQKILLLLEAGWWCFPTCTIPSLAHIIVSLWIRCGSTGLFLPAHPGGPCGSRTAHLRSGFPLSGGVQPAGGTENISSVAHCMIRLRFAVKDLNKADQEALKKIPGVLSVTPAA